MPLSHSQTNQLLKQLGHEPRKQLGQNFLIDGNIVQKSLRMADLQAGERVVEVGPGLGTLTESMLEKGAQVYAVEFDRRLCQHLNETLLPRFPQSLHLLHADALDYPLAQLPIDAIAATDAGVATNAIAATNAGTANSAGANGSAALTRTADFKIIANLPYAISTPWLEAVLSGPVRPTRMVLMLQKEAAERFVAEPGNKTYGAISIFTASAYRMAASHAVNRQCFYPIPGVDSVLLSLEALPTPQPWPPLARQLVRQFFIHRRKQIGSLVRRAMDDATEEAAKPTKKRKYAEAEAAVLEAANTQALSQSRDSAQSLGQSTDAEQVTHSTAPDAKAVNQCLSNWLDTLQTQGIPTETRPEAVPLLAWQDLANQFNSL